MHDEQTVERFIAAVARVEAAMHALTVELKSWRLEMAAQRNMPGRSPDRLRRR